ncbi:MAG TPA: N-formylglutamate amidohydrolase [Noviherbaspirillum sp.]|jgi:predicted N-formylglutamate amidohydrolase|uniref:N-formylglutamate amidohydrolase n=1 Tax=Noviherbaspirillum sp. TaxID=1926288 RepID=UPI002F92F77A
MMVTCEHGGNRIPPPYRHLFRGHESLLRTHRGHDPGALRLARELAAAFDAPLLAATVSRLLIDLNRSPGHPRLFSEASRRAPGPVREAILRQHYLPYRVQAEAIATAAAGRGARVLHVSCHSFTPQLGEQVRNADIGLLYDPARAPETRLCRRWKTALSVHAPSARVRMNYPYAGTADGLTTHLRRRIPPEQYLGIELEINQKHVLEGGQAWRALRAAVIAGLREAVDTAHA